MEYILMHINEIGENEVLAKDIYIDNKLIIAKDSVLTKRVLNLLKRREIKKIFILNRQHTEEKITTVKLEEPVRLMDNNPFSLSFLNYLEEVGNETRYGKILYEDRDVEFVKNLFEKIHLTTGFIDKLYKLKEWDPYGFIHSFDVFVLGTLLAKRENIPNIETVALGYLFHDIGKLHVPRNILNSKIKLSYEEFNIIQTHTTEGYNILTSLDQDTIAAYALSHHERMDGSGYPNGITEEAMSEELKILQIVDVFSALTLNRPYKDALSTPEALGIIVRDSHKYDQNILMDFIEYLNIYPPNSTVLLSDNTYAKVEHVDYRLPLLPKVKRVNGMESFELPYDFNITISKIITYTSPSFQELFNEFSSHIIFDRQEEMLLSYHKLIDGLRLEEIYTQLIIPMTRVLFILHVENRLSAEQLNKRINSILSLLQLSEDNIMKEKKYSKTVLFKGRATDKNSVYLKIIVGLLHVEGILPIVMDDLASFEEVSKAVQDYNIKNICLFNSSDNHYGKAFSSDVQMVTLSPDGLEFIIESIQSVSNRSLQLYNRIFAKSELSMKSFATI